MPDEKRSKQYINRIIGEERGAAEKAQKGSLSYKIDKARGVSSKPPDRGLLEKQYDMAETTVPASKKRQDKEHYDNLLRSTGTYTRFKMGASNPIKKTYKKKG